MDEAIDKMNQRSHTWSVIDLNEMDNLILYLDFFSKNLMKYFTTKENNKASDILLKRQSTLQWTYGRRIDLYDFVKGFNYFSSHDQILDAINQAVLLP